MTTEILPTRSTLEAFARPDPEVLARPKRRRFTAEYRMSIVREADACKAQGRTGCTAAPRGLVFVVPHPVAAAARPWRTGCREAGAQADVSGGDRTGASAQGEREAHQGTGGDQDGG